MCQERCRLLLTYQAAVDRYLDSVRDLRSRTGTSPHTEYCRLLAETEQSRQRSESARTALVAHMQSHRCYPE